MDIPEFIKQLNLIKSKNLVYNHNALKKSLLKLDKLIGMKKVKETIINQIKFYIINKKRDTSGLDSHMFHTTVLGPPGCGKTTLVEILAEIWVCLGLIHVDNKETQIDKVITPDITSFQIKIDKIRRHMILEKNKISTVKKRLTYLNNKLNNKEISSLTIQLDRLASSINKNIKLYCENDKIINIEKVEDEDYEMSYSEVEEDIDNFNPSDYVIKLKRSDLVGKYVGHTAIKTKEALMKGLDKVIFIDEAYELYNSNNDNGSDSFGMECLSTILNFMNEYSNRCIIVFAGYESLLKDTIFRVQPGLERRIAFS